jgi:small subunit ribosomal protein S16
MLKIRFLRVGKKHQPSFKIVVTDSRNPPQGGRFVEQVGFYNPLTKEKILKPERIRYWLEKGAQPSDVVYNLLIKERIMKGKKKPVHKRPKKDEKTDQQQEPSQGKEEKK